MVFTYIDYRGYRAQLALMPTGYWGMLIVREGERIVDDHGSGGQKDVLLQYARQLIDDDIARRGAAAPAGGTEAQEQW